MTPTYQRAAILLHTVKGDVAHMNEQEAACRWYCQQQGYRLAEHDLYQDEGWSFDSNAPQLVRLRRLTVQGDLDVLVLADSASLGILPPWQSNPVDKTIEEFYRHGVRIESVVPRYRTHDLYRQMLLDAIHFVEHFRHARMNDPQFSMREHRYGK